MMPPMTDERDDELEAYRLQARKWLAENVERVRADLGRVRSARR